MDPRLVDRPPERPGEPLLERLGKFGSGILHAVKPSGDFSSTTEKVVGAVVAGVAVAAAGYLAFGLAHALNAGENGL